MSICSLIYCAKHFPCIGVKCDGMRQHFAWMHLMVQEDVLKFNVAFLETMSEL